MSKDVIDEQEFIDNMVDNKPESNRRENGSTQGSVHIQQVGCGCFDRRKMLMNLLIYTVVLMVTSGLFPGFYIADVFAAFGAAVIMSLLNIFVKPLLIVITIPLTVMTLGLFYFVINGIILLMTASWMGSLFEIRSLWTAVFAAIFISFLQNALKKYFTDGLE